jgi:hypothetical protein
LGRAPALLIGIAIVAGVGLFIVPPIPQQQWYHNFADKRSVLGIPNFADVISNAAFLLVGGWGIACLASAESESEIRDSAARWMYLVFFIAVALTGVGSAYYHLQPDDQRLVWDRLSIAITLMALFGAIITENLSRRAGSMLFLPLMMAAAGAVFYWHLSESWGRGDLRPYLWVQLYPVLAIPLILWLSPASYTKTESVYIALAWYGGAKLYEFLDGEIYALGHFLSGHTLKHLGSAVSCYMILSWLRNRRPVERRDVRSGVMANVDVRLHG